jgi:phosphocarrier protein
MLRQPITIINKFGLHTRAAAKLVAAAGRYESKIELIRGDNSIDAKSIMALITLGATQGTVLDLVVSGKDENEARDAIVALVSQRFGEAE